MMAEAESDKMEMETEGTGEGQPEERKAEEIEESDAVRFSPPAYLQRYAKVRDVIEGFLQSPKYKEMNASTGKTVMELGCAEFGMMRHLKNLLDLVKIIFVDLDKQLLQEKAHLLKPLPAEYLRRVSRPEPLVVEAYAGCVTKVDADIYQKIPDIFAVVGIEIIEHLHADVLRGFEETVFGITMPHLVIVTTPNSDFNPVFKLPPGSFRHWDHKFEWSRAEFIQWCDKITAEFPMYSYTIEGICEGPEETRHLGCVSQMAVFEKYLNYPEHDLSKSNGEVVSPFVSRIQPGAYELIQSVEYPNFKETRSPEQVTLDEFHYHLTNFILSKSLVAEYEEKGLEDLNIPLDRIKTLNGIPPVVAENVIVLKTILEGGGYSVATDSITGEMSVVMNIESYAEANFGGGDDEIDVSEEEGMCEDLSLRMNLNRVVEPEEEIWE